MRDPTYPSLYQIHTRVRLTEPTCATVMNPNRGGFISMFLRGNTTFLK